MHLSPNIWKKLTVGCQERVKVLKICEMLDGKLKEVQKGLLQLLNNCLAWDLVLHLKTWINIKLIFIELASNYENSVVIFLKRNLK